VPQLTHRSADAALLLDAQGVATLLSCSARTVVRLAAASDLPPPIKIGRLARWPRAAIEEWIAARQLRRAE
jgi:excisionase family DNA binding protein